MKIKWLGQSGYLLYDEDAMILIDPYLSDVVNRVANRPRMREVPIDPKNLKADVLICTHNHLDHTDIDSIPLMDKAMDFYAPSDCEKTLKDMGVLKYHTFNQGDSFNLKKFKISAVFAEHTVPAIGIMIEYNGEKLYFSGDTYYNKKIEDIKCDYLFICINGKLGNMDVKDAVKLTNIIKPKLAVPNHYDMFESNSEDPKKYTDNVKNGFIMEFNKEYEVKNGCLS